MKNIESISVNPQLPLATRLKNVKAYGAPVLDVELLMNTNENPYQLPEKVIKDMLSELSSSLADMNRYPDRLQLELRDELANYVNQVTDNSITSNEVWAANGSNEILNQILVAFFDPGAKALGFVPSYSMHKILSEQNGYQFIEIPRNSDFSIDILNALEVIESEKPRIIFITSPNNPTGTIMSLSDLEKILHVANDSVVIFDEAYGEFSREPSAVRLIGKYSNLFVTRTMSKAFAFAGARVGYAIAQPESLAALGLVRLPYHLSTQTQILAKVALRNYKLLQSQVKQIINDREFMQKELTSLGLVSLASDANFFLLGRFKSKEKVFDALVKASILVRDVGIPEFLRVTVPSSEQSHLFVSQLATLLDNREIELV